MVKVYVSEMHNNFTDHAAGIAKEYAFPNDAPGYTVITSLCASVIVIAIE
jgi:hypothetical protein